MKKHGKLVKHNSNVDGTDTHDNGPDKPKFAVQA
jgi:hypothetical protein